MLKVEDSIMSAEQRSELPNCIATVRMAIQKKLIEAQTKDRQDKADKPKRYVDLAGLHIEKLSRVAAKKKKMRAQASQLGTQQQEENGQAAAKGSLKESETPEEDCDDSSRSSKETEEVNETPKGGLQSLEMAFSSFANKKILLQRLGMANEHMLNSLTKANEKIAGGLARSMTQQDAAKLDKKRIERQLVSFQLQQDGEINAFLTATTGFLDYLFQTSSALFLFQRTYCATDLFEFAPPHILEYINQMQEVLSTIPMRFSILTSDMHDDTEYSEMAAKDFIYNGQEPACRLLTQSLRYQSALDVLGLEKSAWIAEVYKKFNVLSLLNFVFREFLATFLAQEAETAAQADDAEPAPTAAAGVDPLAKPSRRVLSKQQTMSPNRGRLASGVSPSDLSPEDLETLRRQYALKDHGKPMDLELIENLLFSQDMLT
jgi:hypothetical protein